MGTEPKFKMNERWRENFRAAADIVKTLAETAVRVGVPLAAFAWVYSRVPTAWVSKIDVDSMRSAIVVGKHWEPAFDSLQYNGSLPAVWPLTGPGVGDRVKIGSTEFKVTPFTNNLLFAARTEYRDDLIVALGPIFGLAVAQVEVGTVEKGVISASFILGELLAVELARFEPAALRVNLVRDDTGQIERSYVVQTYSLGILDKLAFAAQAPLLAHIATAQALKD